jgi:hypothetical protein
MLEYMHTRQQGLWEELNKQAAMTDDLRAKMVEAIKQFKGQYMASLPAATAVAAAR